jgi:hypothetical protein
VLGVASVADRILALQRTAGNAAVGWMLAGPPRAGLPGRGVLARQPASAPPAPKSPAELAADSFTVRVTIPWADMIDRREIAIRARQQLFGISKEKAEDQVNEAGIETRLLSDREKAVKSFTADVSVPALAPDEAAAMQARRQQFAGLPEPARNELTDAANERFWKRSGRAHGSRIPGGSDPLSLLWLRTLDEVIADRQRANAARVEKEQKEQAVEDLVSQWNDAVARGHWDDAARAWNGFPADDQQRLLAELTPAQLHQLDAAATRAGVNIPRDVLSTATGPAVDAVAKDNRLGWWGTDEIRAATRHTLTFDKYEGAIAYAQSLGQPAGVVEQGKEFAVYDLNRALQNKFYPFSQGNVHTSGNRTNVKALPGVRAFVTTDAAVLEPRWGQLGPHPQERGWVYDDWMVERDVIGVENDPFGGHVEAFGEGLTELKDKDKFVAQFQKAMRDAAFAALDVSQKDVLAKQATFSAGLPPAEADKIRTTGTELEKKQGEINAATDERDIASNEVAKYQPHGPNDTREPQAPGDTRVRSGFSGQGGIADPALLAAAEARLQKADAELKRLIAERRGIVRVYPILDRIKDIAEFNKLDDSGKAKALHDLSGTIGSNIDHVRGLVRNALDRTTPELDLFALENLVNTTIAGLGITSEEQRGWIRERQAHAAWIAGITDLAFAIISLGLGVAAIIASAGAATSAVAAGWAAAASIGSLGVASLDAIRTTGSYYEKQWMTGTDPDREQSFLSPEEEMHWGWVVAAWVGVGLDALQAVHAVKALARGAELAKVCEEAAQTSGKVTKTALMDAAKPHAESSAVWEGINKETRDALQKNPTLVKTLEDNPLAAKALKLCVAPKRVLARVELCYRTFATKEQITRLETALRRAADNGLGVELPELQKAINRAKNPDQLSDTIEMIEKGIDSRIGAGSNAGPLAQHVSPAARGVKAGEHLPAASIDEGFYLTERLRHTPGNATGGETLPTVTRLLEEGKEGQIPGQVGRIPRQIGEKMRAIGHYDDAADFRATFWRLVADDPVLGAMESEANPNGWSASNITLMRAGRPPWVPVLDEAGNIRLDAAGEKVYARLELHHKQALKDAGQIFDLDNIEIVSGWFHKEIHK